MIRIDSCDNIKTVNKMKMVLSLLSNLPCKCVENLWEEFSSSRYCDSYLIIDEESLKEFVEWCFEDISDDIRSLKVKLKEICEKEQEK